jgi:hypothetical protein
MSLRPFSSLLFAGLLAGCATTGMPSPWPQDDEVESVKTWSYLTLDGERIKTAVETLPPERRPRSINLPWLPCQDRDGRDGDIDALLPQL